MFYIEYYSVNNVTLNSFNLKLYIKKFKMQAKQTKLYLHLFILFIIIVIKFFAFI